MIASAWVARAPGRRAPRQLPRISGTRCRTGGRTSGRITAESRYLTYRTRRLLREEPQSRCRILPDRILLRPEHRAGDVDDPKARVTSIVFG